MRDESFQILLENNFNNLLINFSDTAFQTGLMTLIYANFNVGVFVLFCFFFLLLKREKFSEGPSVLWFCGFVLYSFLSKIQLPGLKLWSDYCFTTQSKTETGLKEQFTTTEERVPTSVTPGQGDQGATVL